MDAQELDEATATKLAQLMVYGGLENTFFRETRRKDLWNPCRPQRPETLPDNLQAERFHQLTLNEMLGMFRLAIADLYERLEAKADEDHYHSTESAY